MMNNTTEAYFIPHCDRSECGLGTFEYTCPKCENYLVDYDVWWEEDNIYNGEIISFICDYCNQDLTVKYNKIKNEHLVNIKYMGYHTKKIDKGIYGELSKINEELEELMDNNNSQLLMLCELSDYIGALKGYIEKYHPGLIFENHIISDEEIELESLESKVNLLNTAHKNFIYVAENDPDKISDVLIFLGKSISNLLKHITINMDELIHFSNLTSSAFIEGIRK